MNGNRFIKVYEWIYINDVRYVHGSCFPFFKYMTGVGFEKLGTIICISMTLKLPSQLFMQTRVMLPHAILLILYKLV